MNPSEKDEIANALSSLSSGRAPVTSERFGAESPVAPTSPVSPGHARGYMLVAQKPNVQLKRTMIPILLTCGVVFPVIGSLKWVLGPDSPFADLDLWMPIALFVAGPVFLVLAVVNMLQVRDALSDN